MRKEPLRSRPESVERSAAILFLFLFGILVAGSPFYGLP
jgi:hypothetical protein